MADNDDVDVSLVLLTVERRSSQRGTDGGRTMEKSFDLPHGDGEVSVEL